MLKKERHVIEGIPALVWGEESADVYLFVHGKLSRKEEAERFARAAAQKGWQTLSFDLPEHGERQGEPNPCTPWNGIRELRVVETYAQARWPRRSLFAQSFGCYLSLLAFGDSRFKNALFLSPILDLERLIENMMKWFGVSEAELEARREIPTPMGETLSWEYRRWVQERPVEKWPVPTAIFYGSKDELTERNIVEAFSRRFRCDLTVCEGGEHFQKDAASLAAVDAWVSERI